MRSALIIGTTLSIMTCIGCPANTNSKEWIKKVAGDFCFRFVRVEQKAKKIFKLAKDAADQSISETNMTKEERRKAWRKAFALYVKDKNPKISSVVFSLLDKSDYQEIIWKMLKPSSNED